MLRFGCRRQSLAVSSRLVHLWESLLTKTLGYFCVMGGEAASLWRKRGVAGDGLAFLGASGPRLCAASGLVAQLPHTARLVFSGILVHPVSELMRGLRISPVTLSQLSERERVCVCYYSR